MLKLYMLFEYCGVHLTLLAAPAHSYTRQLSFNYYAAAKQKKKIFNIMQ